MRKIPTLFVRDTENPARVTDVVDPDCKWVLEGEGIATEKFDGSACLFRKGLYYRRHRLKEGKMAPPGWVHWTFDPEQMSGHGWALVGDGAADQYHRAAEQAPCWVDSSDLTHGTYELVGPSLQKNPYHLRHHQLWKHGSRVIGKVPDRSHAALRHFLDIYSPIEGIVWHHPDGRMAKIKRRDFGLPWPAE